MHYVLNKKDKKAITAAKVLVDYCKNNESCTYCLFSASNRPCVLEEMEYYKFSHLDDFLEDVEHRAIASISNTLSSAKEQGVKRTENKQND